MAINHKFTLLAQGRYFGVIGSPDGKTIVPAATWAINSLNKSGLLLNPVRVPAPPLSTPMVGQYRPVIDNSLPQDAFVYFDYKTEPLTGITVYIGYYGGTWYVREIRNTGGQYFRVEKGGAEWITTQAEQAAAG